MMNHANRILFLFAAMLFCLLPIKGESPDTSKIYVLLASESIDDATSADLINVIDDTLTLQLKIRNFSAIKVPMNTTDNLINQSRRLNASYILVNQYSSDETRLSIAVNLIRTEDKALLYEGVFTSVINLEMDSEIQENIRDLIEILAIDAEENPSLVKRVIAHEEPLSPPPEGPVPETGNSERFRKITISAGFSPFFTAGLASTYFTIGYTPEIHGQYRLQTRFGYFGLGAFASMNYSSAEGSLNSSTNILLSFGPEIRMAFVMNPFMDFFIRINVGGTLFLLNKNNEGYISTFMPNMAGGFGINLNFTQLLAAYISTNYTIYFENSLLITGFAPSVGIYFKL